MEMRSQARAPARMKGFLDFDELRTIARCLCVLSERREHANKVIDRPAPAFSFRSVRLGERHGTFQQASAFARIARTELRVPSPVQTGHAVGEYRDVTPPE